jgi:hypothetical protein
MMVGWRLELSVLMMRIEGTMLYQEKYGWQIQG